MLQWEANPILVKELRSRMRGSRAFVLLTIYLLILAGVTLLLYAAISSNTSNDLNAGQQIGKALFLVIGAVALIEVCLITPSLTSGAIAGERERQTYDLLIASLLTPWQIVWGKLASALAFALLLIVAVVPVMSLAFLFGGVSLTEVLIVLVCLVVTALTYASIGLFWSTVIRGSLGATAFAIGSVVLLLLIVPFLIFVFLLLFGRDLPTTTLESLPFIYFSRIAMAAHPFIALGMTESQLSSGSSPFLEVIQLSNSTATISVPSPWIFYVLLSCLFTAILLAITIRMLRPTQPLVAPAMQRSAKANLVTPPEPVPAPEAPKSPPE